MSNKKAEGAFTPKLRFPEFQDAAEWENEELGDMYFFKPTNSYSRDQLNYENGSVKNIHYGDIHTKFSTLFDITKENVPFVNPSESLDKITPESYCVEGDIVFADASEDMEDVGKSIEVVHLNNEKLLAGMHTLLARQKKRKIIVGFGGYLFKSNRIRSQIKREAQGAKVFGISANRLLNIDICFPADKKEQQKIADCLTSLDDLISLQRKKVDALKAYKKGLLQNLFPAEGESLPRLRFPEFQDAGEWEIQELGQVTREFRDGDWIESKDQSNSGVRLVQTGNVGNGEFIFKDGSARYISENTFNRLNCTEIFPGDCLISRLPDPIGRACLVPDLKQRLITAVDCAIVRFDYQKVIPYIFVLYSQTNYYLDKVNSFGSGSTRKRISRENLSHIEIPFPSLPEQQKIADLLTSIDEQIVAQSQRLAALQVHKKGLLQQLFPSTPPAGEG